MIIIPKKKNQKKRVPNGGYYKNDSVETHKYLYPFYFFQSVNSNNASCEINRYVCPFLFLPIF